VRSGFVTIIGRPNAGKSTLLNSLVGEKLAIVTHKAQTTRNRITGIVNVKRKGRRPAAQIVLVDTPGVHKPEDQLNKRMMQEVYDSLAGCDLILLIVDVQAKFGTGDEFLLAMIEEWSARHDFAQIIPISAAKEKGTDELLTAVATALPEGPKYFPEDQITDQPERFIVAELIREQVLINAAQEVPYASSVLIENYEEGKRLTRISAAIFVEREGQKGILIGQQGTMLKRIGTGARQQIERILGTKVYLELFVKVRAGWRDNPAAVEDAIDWHKQLLDLAKPMDAKEDPAKGRPRTAKKTKPQQNVPRKKR